MLTSESNNRDFHRYFDEHRDELAKRLSGLLLNKHRRTILALPKIDGDPWLVHRGMVRDARVVGVSGINSAEVCSGIRLPRHGQGHDQQEERQKPMTPRRRALTLLASRHLRR